jgi:hypothetical protein
MPMYDLTCKNNHEQYDVWLKVGERPPCPECNEPTETLWKGKSSNVIGDECDVWIRHGICNTDGSPRRYTSKEEMRKEAARRGLVNWVEHVPEPGSDKSKHTTKWV